MNFSSPPRLIRGFTIIEAITAIAVISIAASAFISGLVRMNEAAGASRARTGAIVLAQNQIDLILSESPFNPQNKQVPDVLKVLGAPATQTVAVYKDPVTDQVIVSGEMATLITDASRTVSGTLVHLYRATVTVTYNYRNKPYVITLDTVRTSDL